MTYSLLQGEKYLGPVSTISGYGALFDFVRKHRRRLPKTMKFLNKGNTNKPTSLKQELEHAMSMKDVQSDKNLASVLKALHRSVGKADEQKRVIIADV